MRHPYFDLERPIPVAHRGASGERPENTLPAFALALEQGARILETDVHPTRDGAVVILHDETLERTTDGEGPVSARGLAELQRLDAGHRFSTDGGASFPFRGRGIRLPTLEEAFEAFPEARFNVEVKEGGRAFVERVVRSVADADREDRTLLTSGDDAVMAQLHAVLEATGTAPAVGASTGDCIAFVKAAAEGGEPPPGPMALQVPPSFGGRPLVTRELLDFAHAHDVIERLLGLGVDAVMSDFPARVVAAIRRRGTR